MTLPPVVGTSLFPHEDTLRPCLYRLTNHGYHHPSEIEYKKTRLRTTSSGFSLAESRLYVATSLLIVKGFFVICEWKEVLLRCDIEKAFYCWQFFEG